MKENQKIEKDVNVAGQMMLGGELCMAAVAAWLFFQSGSTPATPAAPEERTPMVYSAAFAQPMPTSLLALTGQAVGVNAFVRVPAGTGGLVTDYGVHDGKVYLVLTVQDGSQRVNLYAWRDAMKGWRRE
jgi:hypothetical protein